MRGSLAPLRVSGFGRLLASYTVNELGDAVGLVAVAILVFNRTADPLALAAFFIAAKFLPALVAPALVARLDQLPVRAVLPSLYVLEAATFLLLAWQVDTFALAAVLLLGLIDGTLALAGRGLSRGAVAMLLAPSDQLRAGNALLNLAFGVASVVGLAAGGVLAAEASLQTALLVDAASFLLIAALLAASRDLPRGVQAEDREDFRTRLLGGLRYVRRQPGMLGLMAWQCATLIFFTLILPIEVVYAKETLGAGDIGFGALLAAWSAGILVGGLLFLRSRTASVYPLVLASSAAVGAAYVGIGVAGEIVVACVFSFIGGIGNGIQWISVMTLVQQATPLDFQARLTGLLESVAAAAPGVGFLLGGALTAIFDARVAYVVAGTGVLVLVAVAAVLGEPPDARVDDPDEPAVSVSSDVL